MAKISVGIDSQRKDGKRSVFFVLSHKGTRKRLPSSVELLPEDVQKDRKGNVKVKSETKRYEIEREHRVYEDRMHDLKKEYAGIDYDADEAYNYILGKEAERTGVLLFRKGVACEIRSEGKEELQFHAELARAVCRCQASTFQHHRLHIPDKLRCHAQRQETRSEPLSRSNQAYTQAGAAGIQHRHEDSHLVDALREVQGAQAADEGTEVDTTGASEENYCRRGHR